MGNSKMNAEKLVGEIQFQARIKVYIRDTDLFLEQESMGGDNPDIIQVAPSNIEKLIDALAAAKAELAKDGY